MSDMSDLDSQNEDIYEDDEGNQFQLVDLSEVDAKGIVVPCILTTAEFAKVFHIKPDSLRHRYFKTGSYFGYIPDKMPNGRLIWPEVTITPEGPRLIHRK